MQEDPGLMQEMQVQSLGQEDLLEEGMATHCSIPTWRTSVSCLGQTSLAGYSPWGHKRVTHNLATRQQQLHPWFYRLKLSSKLREMPQSHDRWGGTGEAQCMRWAERAEHLLLRTSVSARSKLHSNFPCFLRDRVIWNRHKDRMTFHYPSFRSFLVQSCTPQTTVRERWEALQVPHFLIFSYLRTVLNSSHCFFSTRITKENRFHQRHPSYGFLCEQMGHFKKEKTISQTDFQCSNH